MLTCWSWVGFDFLVMLTLSFWFSLVLAAFSSLAAAALTLVGWYLAASRAERPGA